VHVWVVLRDSRGGRLIDGPQVVPDYVRVLDAYRFVVMRATDSLRAALGKTVMLDRDANGRMLIRPARDKDLGR